MGDSFDRYIEEGRELIKMHPDYDPTGENIDAETCAVDNIASILHGVIARREGADAQDRASDILDRAYRSFLGDYEEKGQPDPRRS